MAVPIFKAPIEVENKLDHLVTSKVNLEEVISAMVSASTECTENDPAGSAGWRSWQMGTRRSREIHCLRNNSWKRDDRDQIASIVNSDLNLRIIVCNTDDGTCIENSSPKNRSKKGAGTEKVIDATQSSFLDKLDRPHPQSVQKIKRPPADLTLLQTYYLCVYHEGEDVRAELSLAIETIGGFFKEFGERIFILGGESGGEEPVRRKKSDDNGSDYDIPVSRKK